MKDYKLVDFFTKEIIANYDNYSQKQLLDCYDRNKDKNIEDYMEICDKKWEFNTIKNNLK